MFASIRRWFAFSRIEGAFRHILTDERRRAGWASWDEFSGYRARINEIRRKGNGSSSYNARAELFALREDIAARYEQLPKNVIFMDELNGLRRLNKVLVGLPSLA